MSALAFIGLAVCIFMWGLQYKLSLYDPPNAASHRIPMAKLLSRNEQFSPAESPIVIRTRTSTKIVYTAPVAVFFKITAASGVTEPAGSFTVPEMLPLVCARALAPKKTATATINIRSAIPA